jgi:hypothetical protein
LKNIILNLNNFILKSIGHEDLIVPFSKTDFDDADNEDFEKLYSIFISQELHSSDEHYNTFQNLLHSLQNWISNANTWALDNQKYLCNSEIESKLLPFKDSFLSRSLLVKERKIGEGGFVNVFHVRLQKDSTHVVVAIKEMKLNHYTEKAANTLVREITIISSLKHFSILSYVGIIAEPPYSLSLNT